MSDAINKLNLMYHKVNCMGLPDEHPAKQVLEALLDEPKMDYSLEELVVPLYIDLIGSLDSDQSFIILSLEGRDDVQDARIRLNEIKTTENKLKIIEECRNELLNQYKGDGDVNTEMRDALMAIMKETVDM